MNFNKGGEKVQSLISIFHSHGSKMFTPEVLSEYAKLRDERVPLTVQFALKVKRTDVTPRSIFQGLFYTRKRKRNFQLSTV